MNGDRYRLKQSLISIGRPSYVLQLHARRLTIGKKRVGSIVLLAVIDWSINDLVDQGE
jgi:hypothetical protein